MISMRALLVIFVCSLLLSPGLMKADTAETASALPAIKDVYFYLGDFDADITGNELENPGSEFGFGMGMLLERSSYFDWGSDVLIIYRQYDTPSTVSGGAFTVVSDDMSLSTIGLALYGRFSHVAGSVRLYAGAGAGLYFSKLTLSASTLGFVGSYEVQSNDMGLSYFYGLRLKLSNEDYLGAEYRHLNLDASLTPVTTGTVEIGGELVVFVYAHSF
jgi:hypothetical protein